MKKILVLLIAAVLVLSGCAKQAESDVVRVGLCVPSADRPYRQALEQELKNLGCYVNLTDGKNNQSYQNKQIAQLVQAQYDLLIIEPVIQAATEALLAGLEAADIPAVLLGSAPEQALLTGKSVCHVGFSEEQAGALQGLCILHTPNQGDIDGDGQVACAVLAGPEDLLNTSIHTNSCIAALKQAGTEVALLACVFGDHTAGRGQALTEGLLDRFGNEIEVLFCGSDRMALGALAVLQAAGRVVNQDVYVVGMGGEAEAIGCIERGAMTGTVMADYDAMAVQVTQAAAALLAGSTPLHRNADYILKETQ